MKFEDYLKNIHAIDYTGYDDGMTENFEDWVDGLNSDEIIKHADNWKVSAAMSEGWMCGKCDQEKNGVQGEILPKHFRLCPKREKIEHNACCLRMPSATGLGCVCSCHDKEK